MDKVKCHCGYAPQTRYNGIRALNAHRRDCSVFWDALYAEMQRIALFLYGKQCPVSMDEYDLNRQQPDFPSSVVFRRNWRVPWSDIQTKAGMGLSIRGKGSLVAKVRIVHDEDMDREILDAPIATMSPEAYLAITYGNGLPICERLYLETGRMWVR